MKKPTMADKAAKKALEQPAVAQQWAMYLRMFGPVVAPAYPGDDKARILLISLLNKIGRRETDAARKELDALKKSCGFPGAAEETLRRFLLGLIADAEGKQDVMADEYEYVMAAVPDFYLPWQKVAQVRQRQFRYEEAARCLDKAIGLRYSERGNGGLLGSLYENLAVCQLMLHRPEDARRSLETAERISDHQEETIWALLYAVTGHADRAIALCGRGRGALVYPQVKEILAGTHPHFCPLPVDEGALSALQSWLTENAPALNGMSDKAASDELSRQLMRVFPCMTQYPAAAAFRTADGIRTLTLHDFHGRTPEAIMRAASEIAGSWWPVECTH